MPEEPDQPDFDWDFPADLNVGSWGYQVLYEKTKKVVKHPIGFALRDSGQISAPQEDSNGSSSSVNKSRSQKRASASKSSSRKDRNI